MKRFQGKTYERWCYPLLVDEKGGEGKMKPEEVVALWGKVDALPENMKDILTSNECAERLSRLGSEHKLNPEAAGFIALTVRKMAFAEWTMADAEGRIGGMLARLGSGDPNVAGKIVKVIQEEIFSLSLKSTEPEAKGKETAAKLTLPLLEALARYPQLAQQTITGGRVVLRGVNEGVRGSLSNWVKCYREELGVGYHDALKRGEFLFQSKNGKPLPPEERERVSLILRSIEDGEPIEVDTARQEIIFPKRELSAPVPQTAPAGGMNFSSKHTFPAEKEAPLTPKPAQPRPPMPTITPQPTIPRPAEPKFNPFRIDPVSKKNTDDKSQYGE